MSRTDADRKKRLRWQSRRALLELDLLLAQFWRRHDERLASDEIALLGEWLALEDDALWRLLHAPPPNGKLLAAKINAAQPIKKGK